MRSNNSKMSIRIALSFSFSPKRNYSGGKRCQIHFACSICQSFRAWRILARRLVNRLNCDGRLREGSGKIDGKLTIGRVDEQDLATHRLEECRGHDMEVSRRSAVVLNIVALTSPIGDGSLPCTLRPQNMCSEKDGETTQSASSDIFTPPDGSCQIAFHLHDRKLRARLSDG